SRSSQAGRFCQALEACLKLGVQWIVPRKDVAKLGHSDGLGSIRAQEACQRIDLVRRAVQGDHAGGCRAAERRLDSEFLPGVFDKLFSAGGETCSDLAIGARARLRRDPVEYDARKLALARSPG